MAGFKIYKELAVFYAGMKEFPKYSQINKSLILQIMYNSGLFKTGESHMTHSLKNIEDHLFKHPQFRVPGDVHWHALGTAKIAYPRKYPLSTGLSAFFSGFVIF